MFLNYRRTSLTYILLSILTLGLYSAFFRKEVARDLNKAYGEKKIDEPGAKFILLNILTFGVHATLWDLKFLEICSEYIDENGKENQVDFETYRFLGMIPIARFWAMPSFTAQMNLVCRIYSDKQLEDTELDEIVSVNRVKEASEDLDDIYKSQTVTREVDLDFSDATPAPVTAEFEPDPDLIVNELADAESTHKIAGHAVVEEYDPSKDQRRIGYKIRFEREKTIEEKEAEEKAIEEQKAREAAEAAKKPVVYEVTPCYRNKRWFTKTVALMLLVFMLPLVALAAMLFVAPPVYDETYMGALSEKYELLTSKKDEKKIIIIGGSSVALGLDSEMMADELRDYEIVNFGLSSDLGIKVMMDLSKAGIRRGDIIIIAPEMSERGMSLYFDGESVLQALDGNLGMLMRIQPENYTSLIGESFDFACGKISYLATGTKPMPARPAYEKDNYDEYGDNTVGRPYNESYGMYGTIHFDHRIRFKDGQDTPYEEFINYVNEYAHYAERKGATVYYSFSAMNKAAFAEDVTDDDIQSYYDNLRSSLQCRLISNIFDYILDDGYFFDNEFNLNDAGVTIRTMNLIDDIKRELEDDSLTAEYETILDPPGNPIIYPVAETDADRENAKDFVFGKYTIISEGSEVQYYAIIGLTESGMKKETLTVPNMYKGVPVVCINAKAFDQSTVLKNLYLGETITVIKSGAFAGSTVSAVYIPESKTPNSIRVPISEALLTEGANKELVFYVSAKTYDSYKNDLGFWAKYKDILRIK